MADNTSIEWSDTTWNPMLGCSRVSKGCDHCYAITQATIRAGSPNQKVAAAFAGLTERRDGRQDWTGQINLLPARLTQPFTWRKPRKVFVNSLSDLFADEVPDEFIHQIFAVMAATPQHTYQILTKRHARMRSMLRDECRCGGGGGHQPGIHFRSAIDWVATRHSDLYVPGLPPNLYHQIQWPLPNVWIGVSVEDQKWADIRIPALRDTPAAVRWLSMEPLLGAVDLTEHLVPAEPAPAFTAAWDRGDLAWVVVGGESGPGARPMHPDWARSLRDQCRGSGVPFFFKQWGAWAPFQAGVATGREIRAYPGALLRNVGKKRAGRLLDGRTWDEYPQVSGAVAA